MKVTYNWLREYTEIAYEPSELVHQLTMLGLEVDEAVDRRGQFTGVVVGHVLEKKSHPDADRLAVCTVDVRDETLTIVCGAPNVEKGQKVAVARPGARLAGGIEIKPTKLRGVVSNGMICSEAELGLSGNADGIMVLDSEAEIGLDVEHALPPSDFLIDIDVTPNRPDCFGALGIAREIASLSGGKLNRPVVDLAENGRKVTDLVKVKIHDPEKCPRYAARFIDNVTVQASPAWLVNRLAEIGIRSINNVVDVTNFVMMETGQPLHAFDYDLIMGAEINVRSASKGEVFTTLDEKSHELTPNSLLICDAEKPVAIAGVMGGLNSEVSGETCRVLLESAYFDPGSIRQTSKELGIVTESSKRFERGVDPNGTIYALDRATQLIAELAGGSVAAGVADAYPAPIEPRRVLLRPERVRLLLGVEVPIEKIKSSLTLLGFAVHGAKVLEVTVPTFRPDVTREADLIEEVARIYGYDNIPADVSATVNQLNQSTAGLDFGKSISTFLVSYGLSEVVTYNLISAARAKPFLGEMVALKLLNPLSEDFSTLRPSLVPSLLASMAWNINRKSPDLKMFEAGSVFGSKDGLRYERTSVAAVFTGKALQDSWKSAGPLADIYDVKGCVERLLLDLKVEDARFVSTVSTFSSDNLQVLGKAGEIGQLGQLSHHVLDLYRIDQPVYFFELDFEMLQDSQKRDLRFSPIPKFPPVLRDLAIVLSAETPASDLVSVVRAAASGLLQEVDVFDVYSGDKVPPGCKSIALGLTFYSMERTLTEAEIDNDLKHIIAAVVEKLDARLRS